MRGNVVCDLDGVVFRGDQAIAGSAAALELLVNAGINVFFCTNNSSRTRQAVADKISAVTGFAAKADQVLGSAAAAALLLAEQAPKCFVLGGEGVIEALTEIGSKVVDGPEAEAVVVGVDFDLSYDRLRQAALAVARGARLVATNDDATYPAEEGFWPGAGSILAAVETASGVKAEVAGKPYQPMRELIKRRLQPGPVWVIGDRPETDLALTRNEPEWTSVLVLTGVVANPALVTPPPDLVAADLAQAAKLILESS